MQSEVDIRLITDRTDPGWTHRIGEMFRSRWKQDCQVTCQYNSLRGMDETHLVFQSDSPDHADAVMEMLRNRLDTPLVELKLMA